MSDAQSRDAALHANLCSSVVPLAAHRTADIVLIFGGSIGALNELTIAYDEGKIIGVLAGTGGVADAVRSVLRFCGKQTQGCVVFERDPAKVMAACLALLKSPSSAAP